MKTRVFLYSLLMLVAIFALTQRQSAFAQSNPRYIPLGSATGALYSPDSGTYSHIGIVYSHPTANNLGCGPDWATRGFLVLCLNSRYASGFTKETWVIWETAVLDIKAAVTFMKSQQGITKVVLVGPSGGAPFMSFYQNVAENGPSVCEGPNKLVECDPTTLMGLSPVDGLIINDGIPGYGILGVQNLNGAVRNENHRTNWILS